MERMDPVVRQAPLTPEIQTLVERKDVFCLIGICMLHSSSADRRLDSALALMRFARDSNVLRDEINRLGGMKSLVVVFGSEGVSEELKVIAALAVAYLLPSYDLASSTIGLRIVECLFFLTVATTPVAPRGEEITRDDINRATASGANILFNHLPPSLPSDNAAPDNVDENSSPADRPYSRRRRGLMLQRRAGLPPVNAMLESTVSLVVEIAKASYCDAAFMTLVHQVCALEMSREVAVRKGLLQVLVAWMQSGDREKIRCSVRSINELASAKDSRMACRIHSQIVDEGALSEVAKLLASRRRVPVEHDVLLAIAQILCSLCSSSHTRVAVMEAKCTRHLVSLLNECEDNSSPDVDLAAGGALVKLLTDAMSQQIVVGGFQMDEFVSRSKWNGVISDVVEGGALRQFVRILQYGRGELRAMAVEALRVLSEDLVPHRRTRHRLCEDGAAGALGGVVNDYVVVGGKMGCKRVVKREQETYIELSPMEGSPGKELYHALCAWASILGRGDKLASSEDQETKEILERGCIQFVEAGGFESLLCIATLPVSKRSGRKISVSLDESDLVVEACRSLASMSPLLRSSCFASRGLSGWSVVALQMLARVLDNVSESDGGADTSKLVSVLKSDALRGIGALAEHQPNKVMIVDRLLPSLFHVKNGQGNDPPSVVEASKQVVTALGFSDDVFSKRIAVNDPELMGDWFCLQRSLLIQSMARSEILKTVTEVWRKPFHDLVLAGLVPGSQERLVSRDSAGSSGQLTFTQSESDNEIAQLCGVLKALAVDAEDSDMQNAILQEYHDVYERRATNEHDPFSSDVWTSWLSDHSLAYSLLSSQVYPLNSTSTEKGWMLSHRRSMLDEATDGADDLPSSLVSDHVQRLMDSCMPSRLIQQDALPIFDLRPESSFDMRTLVMPQRRYLSFQREGQVVSQLCETNPPFVESDDVHWTLAFTNSIFAEEFPETLVQALYYHCPMIRGLSFTRNENWQSLWGAESEGELQDNPRLLANLTGSLPSWVSSIVFDNVLDSSALVVLSTALEELGELSTGRFSDDGERDQSQSDGGRVGSFESFAVRNSPHIGDEAWSRFFRLLGQPPRQPPASRPPPLALLRVLDLSGNNLGDSCCAVVLTHVLDKESKCCLERLDLSGNLIRRGSRVGSVLDSYVNQKGSWEATLAYLNLGLNELSMGTLPLELVALLKHNALSLKSLDLSNNGLEYQGYQFTEALLGSLVENTSLRHLNLSANKFSSHAVDGLLHGLNRAESDSCLAFLRLDGNQPSLTQSQRQSLKSFVDLSRKNLLQKYLNDKERTRTDNDTGVEFIGNESIRERSPSHVTAAPAVDDEAQHRSTPINENTMTVLYSGPLVCQDDQGGLHPFPVLDFDKEREFLWQCLKEAKRDIKLFYDNATHRRLLVAKAKRCSCLHYSGHGDKAHLPFENGKGGPHWLEVGLLKFVVEQDEGAPFKFVFVSACHSRLAGKTFADAGVPHVVCCQQECELKDNAALAFTEQFYLTLALGRTVKYAFEQGRRAVRAAPNIRNAEEEMQKFLLLPENGNHDVPIFDAGDVQEWPPANTRFATEGSVSASRRTLYRGNATSSELSVQNMIQEEPSPVPPESFVGREVAMYRVLNQVLTNRLVSVLGESGVGRSSLVCAVCHYMNARKSSFGENVGRIFFLSVAPNSCFAEVLHALQEQLAQDILPQQPNGAVNWDWVRRDVCKALKGMKALLVIDHTDCLDEPTGRQDLIMFLSILFRETRTRGVKVLLTGRKLLGVSSIGGVRERSFPLTPLNFGDTVRLFSNMCIHFDTITLQKAFVKHLVTDEGQASLLPNDDRASERTKALFEALGNGIPSKINDAAYSMSWNEIDALY